MIRELKKHNRNVKKNIFRSLQRIREEYLLSPPKVDDAMSECVKDRIKGLEG